MPADQVATSGWLQNIFGLKCYGFFQLRFPRNMLVLSEVHLEKGRFQNTMARLSKGLVLSPVLRMCSAVTPLSGGCSPFLVLLLILNVLCSAALPQ